jgi:large subunit ribosomal protein L21
MRSGLQNLFFPTCQSLCNVQPQRLLSLSVCCLPTERPVKICAPLESASAQSPAERPSGSMRTASNQGRKSQLWHHAAMGFGSNCSHKGAANHCNTGKGNAFFFSRGFQGAGYALGWKWRSNDPWCTPNGGASAGMPFTQLRGYKSLKKSMKPLNMRASKLAVQAVLARHPKLQQAKPWRPSKSQVAASALCDAPIIDTALPPLPAELVARTAQPTEYVRLGSIEAPYAPLDTAPIFAVVALQGTQFKVTPDDILFVNHLPDVGVNEVLALGRVLLVGGRDATRVGRPHLPGAAVLVAVEEHFRDGVVHVLKFKKRNRHAKYNTARQALTALRVVAVVPEAAGSRETVQVRGRRAGRR